MHRKSLGISSKHFLSVVSSKYQNSILLVTKMAFFQIEDEREYIDKICRSGKNEFGMPSKVIPKQPIAVNMSRYGTREIGEFLS